MAILPLSLARVSNLLKSSIALQSISDTQVQLLAVQNELSTGKRVNVASDDPSAASVIQQLQKTLELRTTFSANIDTAKGQLGMVDTTLASATDLLNQAQSLASANVGSDVTSDQRKNAATVIDSILSQMLTNANTQYNGSYLFAGDKATDAPFKTTTGGVQFVGGTSLLQNSFDEATQLSFQASGADLFGGMGGVVQSQADLTPGLSASQRLIDLRGASGFGLRPGVISVGNGTVSRNVDLSQCDNVGDVVGAINAAAVPGVTAAVGANGLTLNATGGANITVNEVSGGSAAADLGIQTVTGGGADVAVVGLALKPNITPFTPLTALKLGAGISAAGMVIKNGTASATIVPGAGDTVQDLLNKINGSNLGVQASINPAGTGIDLHNLVQGTAMTVGENGGSTATDLGLRSFAATTALSQLNGGKGVGTVAGNDFSITDSTGAVHNVDLVNPLTVQDVLTQINAATAGTVTASLAVNGNGIVLTDSAGGASKPIVTALNSSTAAADLGLTGPAVGNVITGTDVNPINTPGVFGDLQKLRDALTAGDATGITAAAGNLKADTDHMVQLRGGAAARLKELTDRQSRIEDENVTTKTLLSQLQDVDYPSAITKFQTLQTALQATLQTTGKTLNLSLMDYLA